MSKRGQFEVEEEVDGVTIISRMFDPLEVYRLAPRVMKIFLPILRAQGYLKAVAAKAGSVNTREDLFKILTLIDLSQLIPVLKEILDVLALPENIELPQELLCRTSLKIRDDEGAMTVKQLTSKADINDAFRGKVMRMLKVMWFAAAFNFADFFPGASEKDQTSNSPKQSPSG